MTHTCQKPSKGAVSTFFVEETKRPVNLLVKTQKEGGDIGKSTIEMELSQWKARVTDSTIA
jgi:hypothetical protein